MGRILTLPQLLISMANAGSVHWQDMACVGRVCDPARRLIEPAYNVQSCGSVRIRPSQ